MKLYCENHVLKNSQEMAYGVRVAAKESHPVSETFCRELVAALAAKRAVAVMDGNELVFQFVDDDDHQMEHRIQLSSDDAQRFSCLLANPEVLWEAVRLSELGSREEFRFHATNQHRQVAVGAN